MSRVLLFECSPRRASDGAVVTQRFCYKAPAAANFLGLAWEPVVIEPPSFTSAIGFDGREFGARPEPQNGDLVFALTPATAGAAGLIWKNAAVTIRMAAWPLAGGNPAAGAFSTIWTGRADGIVAGSGRASVTLIDNGQALRDPAIITKFGTSGDSLLDSADAVRDRPAGQVVPQAWGQVLNIPGLLIDRANGIWLFANSAATAVAGFYDGGAAFTLGTARASLSALQANVPAAGAVDYCLNAAGKLLARPWDTPNFPFTADATFGNTRAADIASAIVTARTSLAFGAGVVAAFNALQPAPCGLYVDDDTSIAVLLDRLFSGLGAFWRLTSAGAIDVRRIGFSAPVLTVQTFRGRPTRQTLIVPTGRRSLGYARNWRVHSESEIAAILLADDLAYADGTSVEALKPGVAGATRNDDGFNMIPSPVRLDQFSGGGGCVREENAPGGGGTSGLIDQFRMRFNSAGFGGWTDRATIAGFRPFAVTPGERLTMRAQLWRGGTSGVEMRLQYYSSNLTDLGFATVFTHSSPTNAWVTCEGPFIVPAGVAYVWPYLNSGSGGNFGGNGYLGRAQPGATFGAPTRRSLDQMVSGGVRAAYDTNPLTATTSGSSSSISIGAHNVSDDEGAVSYAGGTITGLATNTNYYIYDDDPRYQGGSRSYVATTNFTALAAAGRRYVGFVQTPASTGSSSGGGSGGSGGGTGGGGGGGGFPLP